MAIYAAHYNSSGSLVKSFVVSNGVTDANDGVADSVGLSSPTESSATSLSIAADAAGDWGVICAGVRRGRSY